MTQRRLLAGIAVLTLFYPSLVFANPVPRQSPISGQVVSIKDGEDIVFAQEKSKRDIFVKQDLKAGDVLKTNAKGALSIVFADQTQIRLARNTTLLVKEVTAGSPSEIEMKSGSLWARAPRGKSKLTVRTPAATAAIRGTEWTVTVNEDHTDLQVASGTVEFSNPQGQLDVSANEAARAQVGQAPVRVVIVNHGSREQMLYYLSQDFIPSSIDQNSDLGKAYDTAYLGDVEAAEHLIDKILSASSVSSEAFWLGAKIGFLTGNKNRISSALEGGLSNYPDDAPLLALRAEYKASFLGRPDLAISDARRARETDPTYAPGLLILSKVLLERQADIEAMEIVDRIISIAPNMAEAYVHKADILLKQNRPHYAKQVLQTAFALSPDLSIARLGMGQVAHIEGDNAAALENMLAASAGNPSYSLALLRLAEVYGHMGQEEVAKQQLDAADRLDPNTPFTPLYRTSLALHHYESGEAVEGAQDALARFQARGGVYENLSENRETGSNISRSFRFLNLEAWGRYYGDRVFDTFTATSYFDQTLNETAGPFFIRREDTSFNPQNGDDPDQISSYLQGVVLDPLSVAQSERELQISKEHFVEASLEGMTVASNTSELFRGEGVLQASTSLGEGEGAIPLAFNLKARRTKVDENTVEGSLVNLGTDLIDETLETDFLEGYLGAELTPKDSLVVFGTFRLEEKTTRESPGFLLVPGQVIVDDTESFTGFAFWTHEFADFNHITLGGGKRRSETISDIIGSGDPRPNAGTVVTSDLLFANWTRRFGNLDLKIGAEAFWNETAFTVGSGKRDEVRAYVDSRYKVRDDVLVSGKIGLLQQVSEATSMPQTKNTDLEYDMGVAYEPMSNHWLRLAATQNTTIKTPFTLAPTTALGLKGGLTPTSEGTALKSKIARWDAEWSDRLFTAIEFQDQSFGILGYNTPDGRQRASVNDGSLQRVTTSVNYLLGGNWATKFDYTRIWSEGSRGTRTGDPLPFVPEQTADLTLVWTHPKRVSVALTGAYVGEQESAVFNFTNSAGVLINDYVTFNLEATWEPMDKRFEFRLGLINLLDNEFEVTEDVPAPGLSVFASAKARF